MAFPLPLCALRLACFVHRPTDHGDTTFGTVPVRTYSELKREHRSQPKKRGAMGNISTGILVPAMAMNKLQG
jgi:hypothetical protein